MTDDVAGLVAMQLSGGIARQLNAIWQSLLFEEHHQEFGDVLLGENAFHRGAIEELLLHVEDHFEALELGT